MILIVQNTSDLEVSKAITDFAHLNDAKIDQLSNRYAQLFKSLVTIVNDRDKGMMKIKVLEDELEELRAKFEEASKTIPPPIPKIEVGKQAEAEVLDKILDGSEKNKLDIYLKAMSGIIKHRCEKIKGNIDSVYNSCIMLQKTNEIVKDVVASLEPIFNIWFSRSALFENFRYYNLIGQKS